MLDACAERTHGQEGETGLVCVCTIYLEVLEHGRVLPRDGGHLLEARDGVGVAQDAARGPGCHLSGASDVTSGQFRFELLHEQIVGTSEAEPGRDLRGMRVASL